MNIFPHYGNSLPLLLLYANISTWARALPPSRSSNKPLAIREIGPSTPTHSSDIESLWIKCNPTPVVDGQVGLDCTLLGNSTPIHRRSVNLLGRDSHLRNTKIEEPINSENSAANLYPCRASNTSGARRLRCARADRAPRKVLDDSTYEFILSELLNGLPLSVGANINPIPEIDTTSDYYVQLYPDDNSYDLRLLPASAPPELESPSRLAYSRAIVSPRAPTSARTRDQSANQQYRTLRPAYGGANTKRTEGLLAMELRGVLYCWYHENKYDTELELNCGIEVEASALIAVSDSDDESDDEDELLVDSLNAQQDYYQDQLVKYLYSLVIPPLISLYNAEDGAEDAWLKVPKQAAKLLVFRLSELIGGTTFEISTFDWAPVIKGVMYNLREATKQRYASENTDSVTLFEMLLTHYLEIYSSNSLILDNNDLEGISAEWSNGQVGFFNHDDKRNEHMRRQLRRGTKQKRVVLPTPNKRHPTETPTAIIIDRWFRCFQGTGEKVLCETPDWYDQGEETVIGTFTTTVYNTLKGRNYDKNSPFAPDIPALFSAGPPKLWKNCKFDREGGKYRMVCPMTTINPEYIGAAVVGTAEKFKYRIAKRGIIAPPGGNDPEILTSTEGQPLPTAEPPVRPPATRFPGTPPVPGLPGLRPVFGSMVDALAWIGFFTILTLCSVVVFLVVGNLFLKLQNSFENFRMWDERRRHHGHRQSSSQEGNIDQFPTLPAPAYVSNDHHYHIGVDRVSEPTNTALLRRLSNGTTGTTGIETVEGGGDSVKRKKVLMRGTNDEEDGAV